MIRKNSLIILLLCSISVYGKEIYLRPYIRYHLALTSDNSPVYFNIPMYNPKLVVPNLVMPDQIILNNPIPSDIENFSLAQGFKYGCTLGYTFNDVLGVELSSDYFSTNKTFHTNTTLMNGILNWKLNTWNIIPTFTFSRKHLKSSFLGKVGFIAGITDLEKSIRTKTSTPLIYRFDKNLNIGYTFSIEYNYKLSDRLSISSELGFENIFYTPTKAQMTKYFNSNYPVDYYPEYIRTIKYVDNISNQDTYPYYYSGQIIYLPNQNSPQLRLKETLKMYSLFLGISIKYSIINKWK